MKKQKANEKAHDGAATPCSSSSSSSSFPHSSSAGEERERPRVRPTCIYIYIYTLGATNFQRRRRWRQHLKLHARQINRPLFRKAKCYSRIVLGETLLLIFKFEDGKVARENGGPRIREERMGRMNEQGGDERERERDVRALGAPSAPYEELDCLQITKMAG